MPPTDLSAKSLIRLAWQGRMRLGLVVILFTLLGIVVALLTTPEFVSEARIMPEMNSGDGGVFKRLASVAGFSGFDLSDAEEVDAVRPDLYPNVLQSTPFVLYLLDQAVAQTNGQMTTIAALLWPADNWSLGDWFSAEKTGDTKPVDQQIDQPLNLSRRQEKLIEDVGKRVHAKLDTRSGVITITARMPDARVAATAAQLAMNYLTQYVTSYRTEKARQDLRFYTRQLNEARKRYQLAQYGVFRYDDEHKNFVVQAATMEKQRREAELMIAQTVYTELSRQFEQAKLKVQERTPVFKVLEPAKIPRVRISPKRTLMVLVYAMVGLGVGMTYLVLRRANPIGWLRALVAE
ncbi:GNVR domain-containing protein [Spirosoma agri]|uniref:Lipopolysaccharide biosynthesis protein n=2 Tax=Spirosoma agri TaxID=1987381 RepID=A0A6M0IQD8_9BACT|nr:lipopolysaccharide biosynthesis protein [Spirosoma agri]